MQTNIGRLGIVVAALVAGTLIFDGSARAAVTTAKHHHHHIHGKITAVSSTSITIEVHKHHKKGAGAAAGKGAGESKTFQITNNTKVISIGPGGKTTGSVANLSMGEHVAIGEHDGVAHVIIVSSGHHRHGNQGGAQAAAAGAGNGAGQARHRKPALQANN